MITSILAAVVLLLMGFTLGFVLYAAGLKRMERTIDRMEVAASIVADNLAASIGRADATVGPEGAAADAALRTGDTAKAIRKRQASKKKL